MSICISIFCTCAVFGRFSFYCLPDQQSFFYVSLVGLLLSTIISVLFVSSNGVRTGSFLLFVLFATGVPFWYALANKCQWHRGGAERQRERRRARLSRCASSGACVSPVAHLRSLCALSSVRLLSLVARVRWCCQRCAADLRVPVGRVVGLFPRRSRLQIEWISRVAQLRVHQTGVR